MIESRKRAAGERLARHHINLGGRYVGKLGRGGNRVFIRSRPCSADLVRWQLGLLVLTLTSPFNPKSQR